MPAAGNSQRFLKDRSHLLGRSVGVAAAVLAGQNGDIPHLRNLHRQVRSRDGFRFRTNAY